MAKDPLTLDETRAMFLAVARRLEEAKDQLTRADQAIGDGDHGVGMARGAAALRQKLENQPFADLGELLKAVGTALLTSVGGAAGAIFGTLFRGGAKQLGGRTTFDAAALALLLNDGLQAVQERGQAKVGDKTMVDALAPAARASLEQQSAPLGAALAAAATGARDGVETTKDLVATVGKAKTLGERALGHPDPGALSTHLILQAMAEFAA